MADYIPFVNNDGDIEQLRKFYSDATTVRVLLPALKPEIAIQQSLQARLWIDPGIDGYHCLLTGKRVFDSWRTYIQQFTENSILADRSNLEKPPHEKVRNFVFSLLEYCASFHPDWITIPQLPIVEDTSRNRMNRELANATGEWRSKSSYAGQLILPLIFTHQDQLRGRTAWKNAISTAVKCYADADARGFWGVDSDLDDQKCRTAFQRRFEALIGFHEDLRAAQSSSLVIAGPYWGMNIVLWARHLCDHPAISMGSGYRYMVSGTFAMKAKKFHVALAPLRRWVVASPELRTWLEQAILKVGEDDSIRRSFEDLSGDLSLRLKNKDAAKEQVARSYKEWFDKIQRVLPTGRPLALYQDLASAYVLGKALPTLPKSEAPGRDAGKVAEQLMLHCL